MEDGSAVGSASEVRFYLRAARGGDTRALAKLWSHFEPHVDAYVRARMGAAARRWREPEAVVQRTLVEVLGSVERLPEGADEQLLLRYLYRTALTRIWDARRAHGRDVGESALGSREPAAVERGSDGVVTREDTRRWVRELVEQLPEKYAQAVHLCALEELSFVEAGRRLGVSADAVRKRYERARNMLAARLRRSRD